MTTPGGRPISIVTKLSLAGIFATGCSSAHRFDLVLSAGKVLTLDSASPSATAVAIGNGRIVAVGDSSLVSDAGSDARVVRLDGAVVAPALIDHHVHLFNVGLVPCSTTAITSGCCSIWAV